MKVEVWSDVICPWCWLGRARLAKAVAASPKRADIEVVFRSFELDATTPKELDIPTNEMLKKKLGMGQPQIDVMHERIAAMGKEDGIDFQFDKARTSNTFEAHQLVHLAAEQGNGKQTEMVDRLFKANFHDGIRVGDRANLVKLAEEVAIVGAAEALESARFADAVRADEAQAKKLGIGGVPFFLIDGAKAVSGAQSVEVLVRALS